MSSSSSSFPKRRCTTRTTGRRRREGTSSSSSSAAAPLVVTTVSIVKDEHHAANMLANLDRMRRNGELTDLVILPESEGCGGSSGKPTGGGIQAHAVVMAAACPFIHSKVTRWRHDGGIVVAAVKVEDTAAKGDKEDEDEDKCNDGEATSGKGGKSGKGKAKTSAALPRATADGEAKGETAISITIPELDESTIQAVVEYAYTGSLALDTARKDSALKLLAGLQLLDMVGAQATVVEWLVEHLEPSSVLRVKRMAEMYHLAELADKAEEYVDTNFKAVSAEEEWKELGVEDVESIVTRDELRPSGEMNVFRALVRWARAGARHAAFVGLLCRCLRAPLMTTKELTTEVMVEPLVVQSREAMAAMLRVVQEGAAEPSQRARFASPAALCQRRADSVAKYTIKDGHRFNYDPWGGTCVVMCNDESGEVWVRRHGVGWAGQKTFKTRGRDSGMKLVWGEEVEVLWDNTRLLKCKMTNMDTIQVLHGDTWYPFTRI